LKTEGNETVTNCHGLKMTAVDGLGSEAHARQCNGGQPSRLSWSAAVSAAVAKVGRGPAHERRQAEQARRPFANTAETAMLLAHTSHPRNRFSRPVTRTDPHSFHFSLAAFSTLRPPSCSPSS
jgi:hypothetical protein